MSKYYWSFYHDAEVWRNSEESVEACIIAAKRKNDGDHEVVYIAEDFPFTIQGRIDIDILLEALEEAAFDFAGEAAEDWQPSRDMKYDKKVELENAITALVEEWLEKHGCMPTFGQLHNVQEYRLHEED